MAEYLSSVMTKLMRFIVSNFILILSMVTLSILISFVLSTFSGYLNFQSLTLFGVFFLLIGSALLPIRWMLALLFFYLGFEGFFKIISGYNPLVHVGVDIYTGLIVLKSLASTVNDRSGFKQLPPMTIWIAIHFLWFLIAFLNPYQLSLVASLAAMKMYVTMPVLFFLGYIYTEKASQVRAFFVPWIAVVALQVIFSIYQAYVGESSVLSIHPGYQVPLAKFVGYAFRPFGFTALAGGPAIFIFLVNAILFYFLFISKKISTQFLMLLIVCGAWIVLFLCQIRSAILKALISSVMFFIFYLKYNRSSEFRRGDSQKNRFPFRLVIVPIIVMLTMSFSFDWMTSSNVDTIRAMDRSYSAFDYEAVSSARANTLERLWALMQKVPLGAGLSRTGAASGKFSDSIALDPYFKEGFFTDNFWLATVVDLGIPGMLILTIIVFLILIRGYRGLRNYHDPSIRILHATLLCCLCSTVVGFYGAESILYNPEAAFFWFFAGVMFKLPVIDRSAFMNKFLKDDLHGF